MFTVIGIRLEPKSAVFALQAQRQVLRQRSIQQVFAKFIDQVVGGCMFSIEASQPGFKARFTLLLGNALG